MPSPLRALLDNSAINLLAASDQSWQLFLAGLRKDGATPMVSVLTVEEAAAGLIDCPTNPKSTATCRRLAETDELDFVPEARDGVWWDYSKPGWHLATRIEYEDARLREGLKRAADGSLDAGIGQRRDRARAKSQANFALTEEIVHRTPEKYHPKSFQRFVDYQRQVPAEEADGLLAQIIAKMGFSLEAQPFARSMNAAKVSPGDAPYLTAMTDLSLMMKWRLGRGGIAPSLRFDFLVLAPCCISTTFITADKGQAQVARETFPSLQTTLLKSDRGR